MARFGCFFVVVVVLVEVVVVVASPRRHGTTSVKVNELVTKRQVNKQICTKRLPFLAPLSPNDLFIYLACILSHITYILLLCTWQIINLNAEC